MENRSFTVFSFVNTRGGNRSVADVTGTSPTTTLVKALLAQRKWCPDVWYGYLILSEKTELSRGILLSAKLRGKTGWKGAITFELWNFERSNDGANQILPTRLLQRLLLERASSSWTLCL